MEIKGARILLTGATGGIGKKVAHRLGERGARLALVGRRAEALDALCNTLRDSGTEAVPVVADISSEAGRNDVVTQAVEALGGVDVLINTAGVLEFKLFTEQDPSTIERIVETNLLAPMLLVRAVLPHLLERGRGRIVNVGSTLGSIGLGCFSAYSASKFGLRGFSEALRRELGGTGIGVTYIAPRATRTGLNNDTVMRMNEATGVNSDTPEWVAEQIVRAIERKARDRYLGWPEALFVRINALLPRLIDKATRKQHAVMREFASGRR